MCSDAHSITLNSSVWLYLRIKLKQMTPKQQEILTYLILMQTFILSDCDKKCWKKFESKEAKWSILALLEKVYWKLELLRKFESNAFFKLNDAFGHFSKNVVDDFRGNYWMSKYVHHWKNLIRLYDTTQSCGHFVFYYFKHFSITIYTFCTLYFICNLQHISKTRLQTV